ncbi:MAG: sigma-70 family RNA polymerase sigma factor [Pirellulaceae bacterium]|nr:sigma-70 family RNA polymerase sigma factor [Planctomycetales bacterium]
MQSDARLVEQCLAGNRDAFAELIGRYSKLVRAATVRVVADRHLCDDAIQETFLAAYKSLPQLRVASQFGPWLLGIARRQAVRSLRHFRQTVVLNESAQADIASEPGLLPADSMALLELVERLSDADRTLVALRHFEGYSTQEIADIVSRPVGSVTKQLSRVHKKLKQWLTEEQSND